MIINYYNILDTYTPESNICVSSASILNLLSDTLAWRSAIILFNKFICQSFSSNIFCVSKHIKLKIHDNL